ncbi:PREDICTED: uncharacterized protein LOC105556948 [Vollenhovia emeryi]|uniref:uncharacterized protein LOC105556948 n=1 Tax=Vollenhovia emeryi TaxID=411798 RepID=UPI0005F3A059|nr:PREDICTED: uncharacterized protein LOC105556948 [Vollenhovia emeryi]
MEQLYGLMLMTDTVTREVNEFAKTLDTLAATVRNMYTDLDNLKKSLPTFVTMNVNLLVHEKSLYTLKDIRSFVQDMSTPVDDYANKLNEVYAELHASIRVSEINQSRNQRQNMTSDESKAQTQTQTQTQIVAMHLGTQGERETYFGIPR